MDIKKPAHCPAFFMSKILFENYLSNDIRFVSLKSPAVNI